ncbi:Unknown protein [Striga hermonthica]|uniref:DUF1985 domain-containing protein n=1 Tax=Striga hermonthica TaxID=68872 RepID=A0A9N7RGJ1_STRHE|nr:Unknown protein [Striga hermonthica]
MTTANNEGDCWSWRWGKACTWSGKINCQTKPKVIGYIKNQLGACGRLREFEESCFGHFLRFDGQAYYSGRLLLALLGREVFLRDAREKERRFLIRGNNYKFGKVEFCQISGLMFGGSEFIPEDNESLPAIDGIYRRHYDGKSVIGGDLLRDFTNGHFQNNPDDALKAAMILIVHFFLFAPDPRSAVPLWLWTLVENSDMFGKFPWGTFSFQRLYHCLDGISAPDEGCDVQLNIHGFLMPFQIQCVPMCLTDAERNAPYMANVELDLSLGLQYIHHDSWKSCCEPLGDASSSSRHTLATKKRKLGQPTNIHLKKLAVESNDEAEEETKRDPREPQNKPREPQKEPVGMDKDLIKQWVEEGVSNCMKELMPSIVEQTLRQVVPIAIDRAFHESSQAAFSTRGESSSPLNPAVPTFGHGEEEKKDEDEKEENENESKKEEEEKEEKEEEEKKDEEEEEEKENGAKKEEDENEHEVFANEFMNVVRI